MLSADSHFQPLFDAEKKLVGVMLSPTLWAKIEADVSPIIDRALDALNPGQRPEPPEPVRDWESLAAMWDFPYPLTKDVACKNCGNTSDDWQNDEPRKFRLRAANMGGLVNFECLSCKARVIKRHFKKHVDVECRPFINK